MKLWRLHLHSPFNWLYKTLLFWNSWGIWAEGCSTPQPMFIPNTIGPSLQHKTQLPGLFCASNTLETASPQLTIYRKATKTAVENIVQHLYRLKSFYLIPLPRIFGCWEYLAWHLTERMVCTQGNHLMIINNDASITTCSLPEQKELLRETACSPANCT